MKATDDSYYFRREARIIKSHYGIDFEDAARSSANVRKLEQLLFETYPANEAASPTCPFLTIAEQAAISIMQTRLVLKHKTKFNEDWLTKATVELCSGKDQVLQGITQGKPSSSGRVFLSIGSPQHESPLFLNHIPGVVIQIHNSVITQADYLQPFWLSPHLGDMIKSADFGKIYFMNSARRMFYHYNRHQKTLPNGFKTYQYFHNDQLVVEKTVSVLDECVFGMDIIPFLLRQFILELRYLGGEYRSHVLNNLFNTAILHAAFDTIINTDSFEISKPGVLHLAKNQCSYGTQCIWPTFSDELLEKSPFNKYAKLFRKGDKLTLEVIEKAIAEGHQLFFNKLLKKGMPINACFLSSTGEKSVSSLLHVVVKHRHFPMLKILLAGNVDVRLRDTSRRNITHYALMTGSIDYLVTILSLRTRYKFDHNIQYAPNLNSHIYTINDHPLRILAKKLYTIADFHKLLQLGLRIDGHFGSICLFILLLDYLTTTSERVELLQRVIDGGADINYRLSGSTPLMLAAKKGLGQAVELLIKNGALINLRSHPNKGRHPKDLLGKTALMLAAEVKNNHQVIALLLKAGADASLCSYENKCAADYAVDPDYFPDFPTKRRKLVEEPVNPDVEEMRMGVGVACVMGYDANQIRYYCLGKRISPVGQLFFPGGYFDVEQDGHLKDTATRELWEETSLALKPVNDLPLEKTEIQQEKVGNDIEFYLFNAGYIGNAPLFANGDLIDVMWVPEAKILDRSVCVFESNLYLVQRLYTENHIPQQFPGRFFHQPNHMTVQPADAVVDTQTTCDYNHL